jgi:hypothetical protein
MNTRDKFGKVILELSEFSHKKKVGPLKIIRLPSDRSLPETVDIPSASIAYSKSIRGSIVTPPVLETPPPFIKEYKIFTTKNSLLALSPGQILTPKRICSNKNSVKRKVKFNFMKEFDDIREEKPKKKSKSSKPPSRSKKMESDDSDSSSSSSSSSNSSSGSS